MTIFIDKEEMDGKKRALLKKEGLSFDGEGFLEAKHEECNLYGIK